MKTLIILPTFNERENIAKAVSGALFVPECTVLVIDDASPDGTAAIIEDLKQDRVFLLRREKKFGLGSAYQAGFRFAIERGYDAVVQMDADGSHDPADIPRLLGEIASGADVAIGSRRVPGGKIVGWGPHRHAMSFGAAAFARHALGLATKDITSGFRAFRADAVAALLAIGIASDGYAFQEEVIFHCERLGMRIKEVPVIFRDRTMGASKLGFADVVQFFSTVRQLRKWRRRSAHGS